MMKDEFDYDYYQNNLEKYWDDCQQYSHRNDPDDMYRKPINPDDYKGQNVIDYGCGGGHLGLQLCPVVKNYIGLDVSMVSLVSASERLQFYNNVLLERVDSLSNYKTKKKIGTIFSFNCIFHFPTVEYFEHFLEAIKKISPEKVVLGIKRKPKIKFSPSLFFRIIQTNSDEVCDRIGYSLEKIVQVNQDSQIIFLTK